jgi:predicted nucleotidyltransferase
MIQAVGETWMERTIRERTEARRAIAADCARLALQGLNRAGIDARVVGSLATGKFAAHSDVDFLVGSPVATPDRRALVERIVADCMRRSGLPYDVIYASDLTPERLGEILGDIF